MLWAGKPFCFSLPIAFLFCVKMLTRLTVKQLFTLINSYFFCALTSMLPIVTLLFLLQAVCNDYKRFRSTDIIFRFESIILITVDNADLTGF